MRINPDQVRKDNEERAKKGIVTVKLHKGTATVVAVDSKYGLDYASFTNADGYKFNVNASAGFIEIYSLKMKLANQVKNKFKK